MLESTEKPYYSVTGDGNVVNVWKKEENFLHFMWKMERIWS